MLDTIKEKLESLWWYIEDGFWAVHDWFADRTRVQKGIIIGVLVVIALVVVVFIFGSTPQEEENPNDKIDTSVESVVEQTNLNVEGVSDELVDVAEALGYDANRANADISYIKQLVNRAFTFSDTESYKYAREALLNDYNVPKDSQFMVQVMPEASSSGKQSLSVLSTDGYVTSVDSDTYEYTLESVIRVTTSTGNVADNRIVLVVKTNGEKNISDLRGYMADFSVIGSTTDESSE